MVLVAVFLVHLHKDKKLSYSPIEGYGVPLGHVLKAIKSIDTGSDVHISSLMANFARELRSSIPSWNLGLVLQAFTGAPFEPLRTANMRWLTFKTVFQVLLALEKCRGELQAFRHNSLVRGEHLNHVILQPDPAFVSKPDLGNKGQAVLKVIEIPALWEGSDKLLCSV